MASYSIYDHGATPTLDTNDNIDTALTVGTALKATVAGSIASVWVYVGNTNLNGTSGTALVYNGGAWSDAPQTVIIQQAFTFQGTVGWQEVTLTSPVAATANTVYIAAVHFPNGHYSATAGGFASEVVNGTLVGLKGNGSLPYDIGNGRFAYGASPSYPQNRSGNFTTYWVDVTFTETNGGGNPTPALGLSVSTSSATPTTGNSVTLTATESGATNPTYAWDLERQSGTFGSPNAAVTTYTPTTTGRHVISCTVTADEGSATKHLTLDVGTATSSTQVNFTASATDPLSAAANNAKSETITRGGGVRYQQRSLMQHRLSFGDPVVNPVGLPQSIDDLPTTYAVKTYLLRDCLLTGLRFMKRPQAVGTYTFVVWQEGNTTPLASKAVPFVVDDGGWLTIELDAPLQLTGSETVPYLIGFHSPDGKVYYIPFAFGSQDVVEHPFMVRFNNGSFGNVQATGYSYGNQPTYPSAWSGHNYLIDPIVEWESDDVVYTGGTEYYHRFSAAASIHHFPIGFWQPLPPTTPQLPALGINTIVTLGQGDFEGGMAAAVAADIDVIPSVDIGSYETLAQIEANPAFNALVKGFLMADEPDMIPPWRSPAQLRDWYIELRKRDASKMLIFNLGKWPVINKGFAHLPSGASMRDANAYWQEFGHLTDVISCDFYMEDSRNLDGGYGIWANPRMVQRLGDISDHTRPIWHYIATAATPNNQPTPDLVSKSVWASIIGGARGIVFFDFTFTENNSYVSDFTMGTNSAMYAMVQSLTSFIQSIKGALLGPDILGIVTTVTSSNKTAGPVGGTFGVPIHYTVRQDSGYTYLLTQGIRPGATTGTFTAPSAANKTITVLRENRTINADSNGTFSDTFAADYSVHLYRWS
jgi:hypothetical protein